MLDPQVGRLRELQPQVGPPAQPVDVDGALHPAHVGGPEVVRIPGEEPLDERVGVLEAVVLAILLSTCVFV